MAQNTKQSALEIDFTGPEATRDPYPLYEQVRAVQSFKGLINDSRRNLQGTVFNALVEAVEAGDKLTEHEPVADCVLLMFTGHETTANLIGNGTLALSEHPEQKQMLQSDGGLIGSAVEGPLRFDSPVKKTRRTAAVDIELGGKNVKSGDLISLLRIGKSRPAAFRGA